MSLPRCVCIDDRNRPAEIPADKWIKEGDMYRILGIYLHLKQNRIQGVTLVEKPLDETCDPYRTFRITRFAILQEDWQLFLQLCRDCNELREMDEADLAQLISKEVEILQEQ